MCSRCITVPLSISEVAHLCGVSRQAVYKWIKTRAAPEPDVCMFGQRGWYLPEITSTLRAHGVRVRHPHGRDRESIIQGRDRS